MLRFILAMLLCLAGGGAHATHLQNASSGLCAKVDLTQATCAASSTQDAAFDPMSGGKYRIRFGAALCLSASAGTVGSSLSLVTCSSSTSQLWTVYKRASNSPWRQYQNDLGNCLGVGNSSDAAGAALKIVKCNSHSASWTTKLEYVYSQTSASTTPIFVISGGVMGAKASGSAAVDAECDCSTFSSGAYCALAATPTRAALCRPFNARVSASNEPLTHTTRAAPSIPTPETMAALSLTPSGRIDVTSGTPGSPHIYENFAFIGPANGSPCVYVPTGAHDIIIRNNWFIRCTVASPTDTDLGVRDFGILIAAAADGIVITGNVFENTSVPIYSTGSQGISVDHNFFANSLGPTWGGSGVQLANITPGTNPSRITCNIFDGRWPGATQVRSTFNLDHINISGPSHGTSSVPIDFSFNRILGARTGGDDSGTGMQLCDSSNNTCGYFNVHDNTVVYTEGHGISVSGGHDHSITNNRVDNRGENTLTNTGPSFTWRNYYSSGGGICTNITVTGNTGSYIQWYFSGANEGVLNPLGNSAEEGSGSNVCTGVTQSGNTFNSTALTGIDMFDEEYPDCD